MLHLHLTSLDAAFIDLVPTSLSDSSSPPTFDLPKQMKRAASQIAFQQSIKVYLTFQPARFTRELHCCNLRELLPSRISSGSRRMAGHVFTLGRRSFSEGDLRRISETGYFLWHFLSDSNRTHPLGGAALYAVRTFLSDLHRIECLTCSNMLKNSPL